MLGNVMVRAAKDPTRDEFNHQLGLSNQKGLIDCKAMVSLSKNTSARDLMWTFANALRLRNREDVKPMLTID